MNFSDIYLVTEKLNKVELTEIESAEKELKTKFPFGFKEFLTTLGSGTYCDLVYIYTPEKVIEDYVSNQNIFKEASDFWDKMPHELNPSKLSELIIFTHTMDGDMLAFHPDNSGIVYVVPRHETFIYYAGINFYQAIETLIINYGDSGENDFRWFNSHVEQCYFQMINGEEKVSKEDFLNFVNDLDFRKIDVSDEDVSEFFIRDFDGMLYLGNILAAKQTFHIEFDCEKNKVPEKFRDYFIQKGFKEISNGKKR